MSGSRRVAVTRPHQATVLAIALAILLPACGKDGGGGGGECKPAGAPGGAEVCLSRGSPPQITATGLQPGSQVIAAEIKGDKAPPQLPPAQAGPDGTFPSEAGSITLQGGDGPLTILVTVTPRGAKPATVTFQRD
jgi:hypothetical protein